MAKHGGPRPGAGRKRAPGSPPKPRPTAKHGGQRPGAGRPEGSTNALEYGEVQALRTLRYRVPEGMPKVLADVAGESFEAIVDVMRGKVGWQDAAPRLKAATVLRHEICGPLATKVEMGGPDGGPVQVSIEINRTVKGDG